MELIFKSDLTMIKNHLTTTNKKNERELSKELWNLKSASSNSEIAWEIERIWTPVNLEVLKWNLCLNEKLETATHQRKNLRNKRLEFVSKCRNFNKLLLMILEDNITRWQATDDPLCCPEVA